MTTSALGRWLRAGAARPNPPPVRVRATLRAVAAPRAPWAPVFDEGFGDARAALDVIDALPLPQEPSVLRVEAQGELEELARRVLEGDWLCDPHLHTRPVHLDASFGWRPNRDAFEWSQGKPSLAQWETCPDGQWLLDLLGDLDLDYRHVMRAICACAAVALDRAGNDGPLLPVEEALADDAGDPDDPDDLGAARLAGAIAAAEHSLLQQTLRAAPDRWRANDLVRVTLDRLRFWLPGSRGGGGSFLPLTNRVEEIFLHDSANESREAGRLACAIAVRGAVPTVEVLRGIARAGGAP